MAGGQASGLTVALNRRTGARRRPGARQPWRLSSSGFPAVWLGHPRPPRSRAPCATSWPRGARWPGAIRPALAPHRLPGCASSPPRLLVRPARSRGRMVALAPATRGSPVGVVGRKGRPGKGIRRQAVLGPGGGARWGTPGGWQRLRPVIDPGGGLGPWDWGDGPPSSHPPEPLVQVAPRTAHSRRFGRGSRWSPRGAVATLPRSPAGDQALTSLVQESCLERPEPPCSRACVPPGQGWRAGRPAPGWDR